ncbi:MAG TPA: HD domain-containing phosphohydrolase [Dissulfurispiraceae bacterium]|nr:HD domain-containing phosphohydrolase [Dissulfurispiraceae bacterium]
MTSEHKGNNGNSGSQGVRERITGIYSRLVSLAREMPEQLTAGERVDVRSTRRILQHLADMIANGDPMLLGMALIENRYDYNYRHRVNTAILAIALGCKVGLIKKELAELGLAAFLADIGKLLVPTEVLNKQGTYDENDWRIMKRHTVQGFKAIYGIQKADDQLTRAAIASFEHHLHFDLSGYPPVHHIFEQDFYARIIAIAEWYDALTTARSYTEGYRSPDSAIKLMLEKAGKELDPVLLKTFVSMMGLYPVGSLVMLDSNELGIVVEPHSVLLKRPRVMVLTDAQGRSVKPFIAALSRRDGDGKYIRSISKTLDPNDYKINYTSFFYRRAAARSETN